MVPCTTLESHPTLSIFFFNLNHTLLPANGNYFIRYVEKGRSRPGKSLTCCYFFHPQPAHLICLLPYTVLFEVQLPSFTSRALTKKKILHNNTCHTPIHTFLTAFLPMAYHTWKAWLRYLSILEPQILITFLSTDWCIYMCV